MLQLESSYTFWERATVKVPGRREPSELSTFRVRFRVLSRSRLAAAYHAARDPVPVLLKESVIDWEGVVGSDGNPFVYCRENLERLVDLPFVADAMSEAYIRGVNSIPPQIMPDAPKLSLERLN